MSTELTNPSAASTAALSMFANAELFALVQRQAQLIATSDLIPKQFQGNVANCAIALEMASRLGASPFAVIQNLDVIHGRPSWRSVFLMGMINASGRFTPLQFQIEETGKARTVELEIERWEGPQGARKKVVTKRSWTYTPTTCIAWAKSKATGEDVFGPPVSYDMALEEGWVAKDGSKWLTEMRELMLRYRAASFFAKVHASDLTLGMQTAEEAYDVPMRDVTPPPAESSRLPAPAANPYVEAVPDKPKTTRKPKAEPAQAEVDVPTRQEIYQALRQTCADAECTPAYAEGRFRKAGLIPAGKTLAETTDQELFAIYQARLEILPSKVQPEPEGEPTA